MLQREYSVAGSFAVPIANPFVCRLRLAMYKGLGFEPIVDKDGRMTKMLVRELRLLLSFE